MSKDIKLPPPQMPTKPKSPQEWSQTQEFHERFSEKLAELKYPHETISKEWSKALLKAIGTKSFIEMEMPIERYELYLSGDLGRFTIGMFTGGCNIIKTCTPSELITYNHTGSSVNIQAEYVSLIKECIAIKSAIEALVAPIREEVLKGLMVKDSIIKQ